MESAATPTSPPHDDVQACTRPRSYSPSRPQASPLYRVLADHFETLERVHEERSVEPSSWWPFGARGGCSASA